MPYEVVGTLWLGVAPPAKVGEWTLTTGGSGPHDWAEIEGWAPVAGGVFAVRYKDDGRKAVVLGAVRLDWRNRAVKRPWPRTVTVRD